MSYMVMSALLRSNIRADLGSIVLVAIQDHMYHKGIHQFDPAAYWTRDDIDTLAKLAGIMMAYADKTPSMDPIKIEVTRLAKIINDDYNAVLAVAARRQVV